MRVIFWGDWGKKDILRFDDCMAILYGIYIYYIIYKRKNVLEVVTGSVRVKSIPLLFSAMSILEQWQP
jgi:hypothetical protein